MKKQRKGKRFFGLLLLSSVGSAAGGLEDAHSASYAAPPKLDDGWAIATPDELGLEREPLEEMTAALRRDEYPNVHAVLIARGRKLVYEEYFHGTDRRWSDEAKRQTVELQFDRDTLHDTRSVGKSITSALVGIAIERGKIESVDQSIFAFFPEHTDLATPEKRRITLEHALTMSAGLDWNEGEVPYTNPANHEIQMDESDDPAGFVLSRPLTTDPGSTWYYSSGLPTLIGFAISRAADQPFGRFAREHLFEPLEMQSVEWGGCCDREIPELAWESDKPWAQSANPAGSLWIRPRDLLKFGSLYLNGGRWNDRQLLPREWVKQSLRPHVARSEDRLEHGPGATSRGAYGYFWWHDRYALPYGEVTVHAAYGNGGQRIWVIPALDLVAVHLTGNYNIWTSSWQAERLLLERIVPWAMNIDADYRHELGRPVHDLEPGHFPEVEFDPAHYVGTWEEGDARVEITNDSGNLLMMLQGTSGVHLIPESEQVFAYGRIVDGVPAKLYWPGYRLEFMRDEDGRITRYVGRAVDREQALFVGKRVDLQQGG